LQHRTVDRLALVLGSTYLAAALIFAWASGLEAHVPPAAPARTVQPGAHPDIEDGARLWALHCASCHDADSLRHRLTARTGVADPAAQLRTFLGGHGPASDTEDAAITTWLLAPPQRGP